MLRASLRAGRLQPILETFETGQVSLARGFLFKGRSKKMMGPEFHALSLGVPWLSLGSSRGFPWVFLPALTQSGCSPPRKNSPQCTLASLKLFSYGRPWLFLCVPMCFVRCSSFPMFVQHVFLIWDLENRRTTTGVV